MPEMRPQEHDRMRLALGALALQGLMGATMTHTPELIASRATLATKYADALLAAQGVEVRDLDNPFA